MNKLSIVTAVTLASIAFVSAEETSTKKPIQVKPAAVKQMMKQEGRDIQMPNIKTGDPDTDALLKTLNNEMEVKIKAIRDEYVLKIRAIVGNRASSTLQRIMSGENGEKKGSDEGKKIGVSFMTDDASSTTEKQKDQSVMKLENEGGKNVQDVDKSKLPGLMNFFRGLFGGNK